METASNQQDTTAKTTKKSTSETGHAKNIANFQDLIAFVTAYGTAYNPTKNALKLPQLNTLLATAQTNLADVITKNTAYNNAVNIRVLAFSDLKTLATKVVNALEVTDAVPQKVEDARALNRKLQGKRASASSTTADPNTPAPTTISTSQTSYDQQIQHFAGIIAILQSEISYAPNETPLKITTLTTKQTDMITKNNAVATAFAGISNSRIARNKTLYNPDTGLVDVALNVKKYVKTIFGATSPEYAQVQGIKFKKDL